MKVSRHKIQRYASDFAIYALGCIVGFYYLFPIVWMVSCSFKIDKEILQLPPALIPKTFTLEHYFELLKDPMNAIILNSFTFALFSTLLVITIASMAAYALSRFRFYGSTNVAFAILGFRMIPPIVATLPTYIFLDYLGLIDTHIGMILVYTYLDVSLSIWLMKGFFDEIPKDVEEAASLDGAPWLTTLRSIILPIVAPGLLVTALFSFIFAWTEFPYALILTRIQTRTMPAQLATLTSQWWERWGQVMAAGVVSLLPVLIFAIFIRRYLVRGLTFGLVK